jgi:CBS domain-containing protein
VRALEKEPEGKLSVLDAGTRELILAYPDELLRDAIARMIRHDIGRLPVVERSDPTRLIGYFGRSGVMAARANLLRDELVRERGL